MRPTILHVGGILYWTIQTRNPDTMVLKDADSTPSVGVRKNGSSVADSVTVTKRSATTGLYDCSYNPASEVEGDSFQFEESAAVTGTTTSSATYVNQFSVRVRALERGTDGALQPTVAGRTLNVNTSGEGDAVLNSEYLFDDGAGRLAIRANVTHYQGTLQGNGDLPAKMDAVYNRIGAPAGDSIAADIAAISDMRSIIAEWIALNIPSDVRGFPATIIGGTDVAIPIEIVDSNNDPITEIFDESVETVEWLFGMGTSARRARIIGSAEWTSDDLLLISIAKADTLSEDDGPRTWMIGCKLTSGELKWVKTGVTRLIGRQFAEPTTTTTGA